MCIIKIEVVVYNQNETKLCQNCFAGEITSRILKSNQSLMMQKRVGKVFRLVFRLVTDSRVGNLPTLLRPVSASL